jgi:hypothetical protein
MWRVKRRITAGRVLAPHPGLIQVAQLRSREGALDQMPDGTSRNGPENALAILRIENGFESEGRRGGDIFLSRWKGFLNGFRALRSNSLIKLFRGLFIVTNETMFDGLGLPEYSSVRQMREEVEFDR